MIKQLTLIGVGLIGGSFVLDLKQRGLVQTVVGVDVNAQNLRDALALGVIDRAESEIKVRKSVGGAGFGFCWRRLWQRCLKFVGSWRNFYRLK